MILLMVSRFRYYEYLADVQTLAMLSCAFSEDRKPPGILAQRKLSPVSSNSATSLEIMHGILNNSINYYPSEEIAKAQMQFASPNLSIHVDYQNVLSGHHSSTSSPGAAVSEKSMSGTTPPSSRPMRMSLERRESQTTSLSTSPEQYRHTHRSSSNLSALAASFSRPFSFTTSAASSPPNASTKKRSSPSNSVLGTQSSAITWSQAVFGKAATITEDPKSILSQSVSENEEEGPLVTKKPAFSTRLKNQNQFHNDGYANVPLLNSSETWRYDHYRGAYADLLYVWGLPIARAEMLKYSKPSTTNTGQSYAPSLRTASLLPIGEADLVHKPSNTEGTALGFIDHCPCASMIPPKARNRRCETCSTPQTPPVCLYCNTMIRGLSSPCLGCGHILHIACRQLLLPIPLEDVVQDECISGCGCICREHITTNIYIPEPTARRSFEVSPAITVIEDPGLGMELNDEAILATKDGVGGEWEDVAYKSLASNLRPKEPRAKGSQTWKK